MKNYLLIVIAAFSLSACNQAQIDSSKNQNDSLLAVVNQRDSAINEFIVSFNDLESNLDSVAIRQHIISISTDQPGELKATQKQRINSEIEAINVLMEQNRLKLIELSRKLSNSSHKNAQLQKTIAILKDQLTQKDIELTALNEKLNNLNAQVTQLQTSVVTLTEEGANKSQTIAEQTTALHTAYYVIGKSKELQDAKLIDRKGGLLGMGKTSKVNGDLDNSKFTRIDYTQTTNLVINSEMKIISNHPSDSYTLEKDVKNKNLIRNLVINNPEKFWSISKYLIIVKG